MKKLLIVIMLAMVCVCARAVAQEASNDSLHVVRPVAIPDDKPSQLDSINRVAMVRSDSLNNEAEKFSEERRAKGDTIATDYRELEKYLPNSIEGYRRKGGPSGQQAVMSGLSFSSAEQDYVSGNGRRQRHIHVSIIDYTNSAMGMWAMMGINMSSEDDHQRSGSMKINIPYTFGFQNFSKDTKEVNVMITTRYRYMISVKATNQTEDQTALITEIATAIAKKFEGK